MKLLKSKMIIICLLLITGCFSVLQSNDIDLPEPGTKYNQTSSPIGGGENYARIVREEEANYVVRSLEELKGALKVVKKYEVIFLPGDIEINLSKNKPLRIPGNIILASNRGYKGSKGALLYSEAFNNQEMIKIQGDSVRISGLRIEGPDKEVRKSRDRLPRVSGIAIKGFDHLEVDNCEIFGWSFGGVMLRDSKDGFIHHNYVHHNRRTGLGYGVVLYSYNRSTTVLIEANYFTLNRHSIAASGQLGISYEARYNYVRNNSNSHSFDMHGDHESPGTGTKYAGNKVEIHHNTFFPQNQGVVIRGIPKEGAWVYENNFLQAEQDIAIRQSNYFGNLHVYDNSFKGKQNAWYVSWGGKEDWYALKASSPDFKIEETYLGDFNNDNKSDLLIWVHGTGFISYSDDSYHGHGLFKKVILNFTEGFGKLLVGNFDVDSTDEVIKVVDNKLYLGNVDVKNWEHILSLEGEMKPEHLRVGDFNGDGKDDVFAFDGTKWFVSYKLDRWIKFKEQNVSPDQILVGNFTNKERDDIFMVEGNSLFQHSFGVSTQEAMNNLTIEKEGPYIAGDFDGDGLADLLVLENNKANISYSQRNSWESVGSYSDIANNSVKVGDFNGDGISDMVTNQKGLW